MATGKVTKKRVAPAILDNGIAAPSLVFQARPNVSREKLTGTQKRENHVTSEQRRREILREYYDELVRLVPDLQESENRSEWQIYMKTRNYLCWLYKRNAQLRRQLKLTNVKYPEYLVWKCPNALNGPG